MNLVFFSGNRAEVDLIFNIIGNIIQPCDEIMSRFEKVIILMGGYHDLLNKETLYQSRADELGIELVSINRSALTVDSLVQDAIVQTLQAVSSWLFNANHDCIVCIYADRAESFGASIAAFTCGKRIIHIEGGDITQGGTFDDRFRHAISALSDFHLPVTIESERVLQKLGYCEGQIAVFPLNFRIPNSNFLKDWQLSVLSRVKIGSTIVIATFHPLSNNLAQSCIEASEFFKGIIEIQKLVDIVILTHPNNDLGSHKILEEIAKFEDFADVLVVPNLGLDLYHSILNLSGSNGKVVLSVGNSSSGLKEVGYFGCNAINVGSRQNGRHKPRHVIDVPANSDDIIVAVRECLDHPPQIIVPEKRESEKELARSSFQRAIEHCYAEILGG